MIRNLHFGDFLKMGQMHQVAVGLNLPNALVFPSSPLTAAIIQHLPVNHLSSSVYIYQEDKEPQAFLQARARQRRQEWEIMALGTFGEAFSQEGPPKEATESENESEGEEQVSPDGSVETPAENLEENGVQEPEAVEEVSAPFDLEMAWLKLLEYMVVDAGEKGVERIYARISTESPELPLFNQTGFHAYTHETLFALNYEKPVERPVNLALRSQRGRDLWQIQRLYEAITPSQVQNAEHLQSDSWEISRSYFPRSTKQLGWVMVGEQDDRAAAYIRLISYRNKYMLRIMNLETQRELLPDLIRFALSHLKAGPDCQVYCSVREYQAEQEAALEELGFKNFGRQAVLVKHTVHLIRASEKALVQVRDRRLELAQTTVNSPISRFQG